MSNYCKKVIFIGCEQFGSRGFEYLFNSSRLRDSLSFAGAITSLYPGSERQIVEDIAVNYGLPVFKGSITSAAAHKWLEDLAPDYAVVMEYPHRIPATIINIFKECIINVHSSDLPKYRGACPLESLIVNGDKLVVTAHKIDPGFDTGPWLVKTEPMDVENLDMSSLSRLASIKGAKAAEEAFLKLLDGTARFSKQSENGVSYCWEYDLEKLLTVDWNTDTVDRIYRKALSGEGAFCHLSFGNKKAKIKITGAFYCFSPHDCSFGKVVDIRNGILKVAAKGGFLLVTSIDCASDEALFKTLEMCGADKIRFF